MDIENYPSIAENRFSEDISSLNKPTVFNKVELVDVDEIIDTRLNKEHKRDYLIKFRSWIPEEQLSGLTFLLDEFWREHDKKINENDDGNSEVISNESLSPKLYISDSGTVNKEGNENSDTSSEFNDEDLDELVVPQNDFDLNVEKSSENLESDVPIDRIKETLSDEHVNPLENGQLSSEKETSHDLHNNESSCEEENEPDTVSNDNNAISDEENFSDSFQMEDSDPVSFCARRDTCDVEEVPSPTLSIDKEKDEGQTDFSDRQIDDVLSPLNVYKPKKRKLKSLDDIVRKISCKNSFNFDVNSPQVDDVKKPYVKEEKENRLDVSKEVTCDTSHKMNGHIIETSKVEDLPSVTNVTSLKANVYWSAGKAYSRRQPNSESRKSSPKEVDNIKCEKYSQYIPSREMVAHHKVCSENRENGNATASPKIPASEVNGTGDDEPPPLVSLHNIHEQSFLRNGKGVNNIDTSETKSLNNGPGNHFHQSAFAEYDRNKVPSDDLYRKYRCTVCTQFFYDQDSYTQHMKKNHDELQPVACEICSNIVIDKKELEKHILLFHSKKCYQCEDCKETFVEFQEYEKHKCRIADRVKVFRCHICLKTFEEHLSWSRHMEYSHPDARKFHCNICGKIYFDHVAFKSHIKKDHNMQYGVRMGHEVSRPFVRNRFPQNNRFLPNTGTVHRVFGETNPRAFCHLPLPPNIRPRDASDGRHMMNGFVHESKSNSFLQTPPALISNNTCFRNNEQIFRSPQMHKPDFPHFNFIRQQNRSENEFIKNDSKKSPMNFIDKEKPTLMNIMPRQTNIGDVKMARECTKCNEKFTSQSLYEIHMQSHGTGSFKCEKCHRIFLRKNLYDSHMKMHEQPRAHLCPYCQRSFSMKGNLRRHIRIHTNEAPYECPICFQRFRRSDGLKGHIRRHETMGESAPTDMLPSQASNK